MHPKIEGLIIQDDYTIIVSFDNGVKKKFDIFSRLNDARFEPLKNKSLFKNAQIDKGGYGISWNDEIDLSEYEIWTYGELLN
jgi:hypothetical protein